jgi:hypothetical protein
MCSRSLCSEVLGGMRGLRQANVVLAVYELDSVIVVYGEVQQSNFHTLE